jgi:adenine-specific DNA-methyltransferase
MSEGLLHQAESVRVQATLELDQTTQATRGQYFTPARAAALIAGIPSLTRTDALRVLDPGAGTGMLTAALVERVVRETSIRRLDVTAVECDETLVPALRRTAEFCSRWGLKHGVEVMVHVVDGDLILLQTGLEPELGLDFDLVVMNPPYRKLAADSWQRRALWGMGWDTGNLYAAFLAVAVDSLRRGGQLVAITPRSFANGPYFEQFRKRLLRQVAFNRVHTFESRSTVFADTGVLQENVVFSATKGGRPLPVSITSSQDHTDDVTERVVPYNHFVSPEDPHQFLRLATDESADHAVRKLTALPASLAVLDVKVSTGRVVDFRSRDNLHETPEPGSVPLVYPGNLRHGGVHWPRSIGKAQAFQVLTESDRKALLPNGFYVLVKRFSAKEERRRIVAAMWDPTHHDGNAVAFENHLNVFHAGGKGLDREFAWGLCLWLNSSVVDRYFRTFSGHTQVNATDLRSMN